MVLCGQRILQEIIDNINNMAINAFRYKTITGSNLADFNLPTIHTYVPSPTEMDYKKGYITRYFIQKSNDNTGYIYEIGVVDYNKFASSPFFKQLALDWRIMGSDDEIKQSNSKSVQIAMNKIPSIHLYLPNLLQFRKPL